MAEFEDVIKISVDEDVDDDKLSKKVREEVTRQMPRNKGNTRLLREWVKGRKSFTSQEINEAHPFMRPGSIRSFLSREDYLKSVVRGEYINIAAREKPQKRPTGEIPGSAYTHQDAAKSQSDVARDEFLQKFYENNKGSAYTQQAKKPIFDPTRRKTGAIADKDVDEYTIDRLEHSRAVHVQPANPEFHIEGTGAPIDLVNNFQLNRERNKARVNERGRFKLNRQSITNLLKFGSKGGQIATNPYGVFGNVLGNVARMGPIGYAVAGIVAGIVSGNVTAKVFIQKLGTKGYPLNRDFFRTVDDHTYGLWSVEEEKRRLLGYDAYIVTQTDRYEPQSGSTTYNSLENRDDVILSKIGLAEKAVGIDYQGWK